MSRSPKRITRARLQRITAHYLERYSTSVSHLRRLLLRRVHRSATFHGEDPAEGEALVEEELTRLVSLGWLDDARYARSKARSLVRRGHGPRRVRMLLGQKGVPSEAIDAALMDVEDHIGEDPRRLAAALYARKRRIGPWAVPPRRDGPAERQQRRQRDLQRMARAGFSYDLARSLVDVEPGSEDADAWVALVELRRQL